MKRRHRYVVTVGARQCRVIARSVGQAVKAARRHLFRTLGGTSREAIKANKERIRELTRLFRPSDGGWRGVSVYVVPG